MKKIFMIIALIMGMVSATFAQNVVKDTIATSVDTMYLYSDSVTVFYGDIDFEGVDTNVSTYGNYELYFTLNGLDSGNVMILYVNDFIYTVTMDSCMVVDEIPVYSDSIIRIDTIDGGHPGIYVYDTIYEVIGYVYDTSIVTMFNNLFDNGENMFDFEDSLYGIAFSLIDTNSVDVFLTNVYLISLVNDTNDVGIVNIATNNTMVYPNPTSGVINIKSDVNVDHVYVFDATGKILISSKGNTANMSNLNRGVYFMRIKYVNGTMATYKVSKY